MKSLNRVTLLGYLAADAELKQAKSGKSVVHFPIATNRNTVSPDGEKSEVADFHHVVGFGKLAEIAGKYLQKGVAAMIEGSLIYRNFDDADGNKHYRTEILLNSLNIISPKKETA